MVAMQRIVLIGIGLGAALLAQPASGPQSSAIQYSKDGKLLLPADYREWVFLSSGIGMAYSDGPASANPPFENVFVNPEAYRGFLKTGVWPDKTVLALEVRGSETQVSINKSGRVQTDITAIEAHVKDASRGGWVFYRFTKGSAEGELIPKTETCYSCHQQNGAVDTTFAQFYPTLVDVAKAKGTFKSDAGK
jgi:hypothetical protein